MINWMQLIQNYLLRKNSIGPILISHISDNRDPKILGGNRGSWNNNNEKFIKKKHSVFYCDILA